MNLDKEYNDKLMSMVDRARMVGKNVMMLQSTNPDEISYLIDMGNSDSVLIIPDNVQSTSRKMLDDARYSTNTYIFGDRTNWEYLREKVFNKLKIIGGRGLREAERMLARVWAKTIDLSELQLSNAYELEKMFEHAQCDKLIFSDKVCTTKCLSTKAMFYNFGAMTRNAIVVLDLHKFDTSNVITFERMFDGCCCSILDLSSFSVAYVDAVDLRDKAERDRIAEYGEDVLFYLDRAYSDFCGLDGFLSEETCVKSIIMPKKYKEFKLHDFFLHNYDNNGIYLRHKNSYRGETLIVNWKYNTDSQEKLAKGEYDALQREIKEMQRECGQTNK